MKEKDIVYNNLERLLNHFGLNKTLINELLNWTKLKYGRIHNKKQDPTISDLEAIASLYGLHIKDLLDKDLKIPELESLPLTLKSEAALRIGNLPRTYNNSDLTHYLVIILSMKYKVNSSFTNSEVKDFLPLELQKKLKSKSIEWSKSKLKTYVLDIEESSAGKTKPKNTFKLIKKIPKAMVEKAQKVVGDDWLDLKKATI